MATKRYAGKNLFEKNPDAVLLAWAKSQEIRDYNKKRAIETNLKRYPTVRAKIEAAKNPCLTVRYVGGLKLKELLAVARNIAKEVPLHGEIRNALCNKARVVTSNDRSIEDLLTNNKRIAKHFFFSCTPWCKQGKHFSKNMSDIEGLCSKIGALNEKFIPADRKEWTKKNIIFSLLDWSNRLISIKTGERYVRTTGNYVIRDENTGKILTTIEERRLITLYNSNPFSWSNEQEFTKRIELLCKRNCRRKGFQFLRQGLYTFFIDEFEIKLQWNKNPLEADLEFDHYHSAFPEDEEFGAEIDSRQSYNGLVELSGAHEETVNLLKEVMKSFRSGNKFILVFPTINLEAIKEKIAPASLSLIVKWPATTLLKKGSVNEGELGFYLLSKKKLTSISEWFYKELTNFSLEKFACRPSFSTFFLRTSERTRKRAQRKGIPQEDFVGEDLLIKNLKLLEIEEKKIGDLITAIEGLCDRKKNKQERYEAEQVCTIQEVIQVRRELGNLVISIKDKNKGQLYVECPKAYQERLKQNTDDTKVFEEVKDERTLLLGIKERFHNLGLEKFGKILPGTLPYMYVIPKQKDPLNKTRLIASYCNHPLRTLYKKFGKILFWGLKKLNYLKQFTLLNIGDLKKKIKEAVPWLRGMYGKNTELICVQTDIKQMFTYLDKKRSSRLSSGFLKSSSWTEGVRQGINGTS